MYNIVKAQYSNELSHESRPYFYYFNVVSLLNIEATSKTHQLLVDIIFFSKKHAHTLYCIN